MPLFKSHPAAPSPEREPTPPPRKGSIFNRRRSPTPPPTTNQNPPPTANRGFFSRRRSSDDSSLGSPRSNPNLARGGSLRSGSSSFFTRNRHLGDVSQDPTILAAKEKVTIAERAEAEADRALNAARTMVREAKAHVRMLEREAAEEHKRAQAKQAVANDVSRTAAALGRHGN
uniref:Uncharacterized protein n=1 Tax=Mycena chlorophos TaxID=658473 RepID=A0ABQ0KX66_MYCCL|nr:predicted protein [Mycena chlorophos]